MSASDLLQPIGDVVTDGYVEVALDLPVGREDWRGIILSARSPGNSTVQSGDILFGGGYEWRSLMITPRSDAIGSTEIIISATDVNTGESDSESFALTVVQESNQPPEIRTIRSIQTTTNEQRVIALDVSDPDGDSLVVTAESTGPSVGNVSAEGATLSLQTTDVSGTSRVTVTVSDGSLETTTEFDVNVVEQTLEHAPPEETLIPLNANHDETTAWMIGSNHVTVVALQSSDGTYPIWSAEEIANAKHQVNDALNWWVDIFDSRNSHHSLSFQTDFSHLEAPFTYDSTSGDAKFHKIVDEFTSQQGHGSGFWGNLHYSHAQRIANQTNWAFTIYLAKSETEARYSTNGAVEMLGLTDPNYAYIISHEIGHLWDMPDEYAGGPNAVNLTRGVYNAPNSNAKGGHPEPESREVSIMDQAGRGFDTNSVSEASLVIAGLRDSDNDGIYDVLDQPLTLNGSGGLDGDRYQFQGTSSVTTFAEQDPRYHYVNDLTINTVDAVEYRLNGGDWVIANRYHEYETEIGFTTPELFPGDYQIEIRTRDLDSPAHLEHGIASDIFVDTFTVDGPTEPPAAESVLYELVTVDSNGNVVNEVSVGQEFSLQIYANDLRPYGTGVFGGYVDVQFDSNLVEVLGPVIFGHDFTNFQSANITQAGLIDEIGAVAKFVQGIGQRSLLATIPMRATSQGTMEFSSNPADLIPDHQTYLFDLNAVVSSDQIAFSRSSFAVLPATHSWHNSPMPGDVNGDGKVSPVDALEVINFLNRNGVTVLDDQSPTRSTASYDVNDDSLITALDALVVINILNRLTRIGSGESPWPGLSNDDDDERRNQSIDELMASLS